MPVISPEAADLGDASGFAEKVRREMAQEECRLMDYSGQS